MRICDKCRHWRGVCTNRYGMDDKKMLMKYGSTKCPNYSKKFTLRWYLYVVPVSVLVVGAGTDCIGLQIIGAIGCFIPFWPDM